MFVYTTKDIVAMEVLRISIPLMIVLFILIQLLAAFEYFRRRRAKKRNKQ